MDKVNVIGLGYIGLPTALSMSVNGNKVIGTDYKKELVEELQEGKVNFTENGMKQLYENAIKHGITFSTEYQKCDIYIIAVPTPYDKKSKKVDPAYLINAVKSVSLVCEENAIIVIESTISPGTIDNYIRPLVKDKNVSLVHAPERIIPGRMIKELENNSRTIGADDLQVADRVKKLYSSFCKGEIVMTDIRTAEMTKVVENTYRDINIAFANELAKICHTADLNVQEIIRIANMHPRVNILSPGPGVGGHCISVDPWFLVGDYPGLTNLIWTARKVNDSMPEYVLERTSEIMKENKISDISRVGFYGLTYKENVDDVRESPTLQLLENMHKHLCGNVKVYDPYIKYNLVENQFLAFLNSDMTEYEGYHKEVEYYSRENQTKILCDFLNEILKGDCKMNKLVSNGLSFVVGTITGTVTTGTKLNNIIEKKQQEKEKFRIMYQMMESWFRLKLEGKNIEDYFNAYGYKHIAIYGMGDIGKNLLADLRNSSVKVDYAIDKVVTNTEDIRVVSPEEKLEKVDAIVVTAIAYFDDINDNLSSKTDCPIISLEDIIYEMV